MTNVEVIFNFLFNCCKWAYLYFRSITKDSIAHRKLDVVSPVADLGGEGRTLPGPKFLHFHAIFRKKVAKQESPPAWTQEAYRLPCSEYSFCCSNWVPPGRVPPHPDLAWGVPYLGNPPGRVPPSWPGLGGYPYWGIPYLGTPPGVCPIAFWVMLQSIVGYGYPPVDRQIDGWMDRHVSKHYLPVVLRTRAVIIGWRPLRGWRPLWEILDPPLVTIVSHRLPCSKYCESTYKLV